jgi:microcystin-dependent protein
VSNSGFFLGEIRLLTFNFAPQGWAECNGQLLPINNNQALFSLLGTMYGGDGTVNFALPDLRDRVPMHFGGGHNEGERGGESAHTVAIAETPTHVHLMQASGGNANTVISTNSVLAVSQANIYLNPVQQSGNLTTTHPQTIASVGGSQAHANEQPYLTLNFCIALQGIFPSRN